MKATSCIPRELLWLKEFLMVLPPKDISIVRDSLHTSQLQGAGTQMCLTLRQGMTCLYNILTLFIVSPPLRGAF